MGKINKIEEWRDVVDYEGLYMVSYFGRIKSLGGRKWVPNDVILNPYILVYYMIGLSKNSTNRGYMVHRLIAKAFIKNEHNKPFINHKDGNKLNNSIDNLEWCTQAENNRHAKLNNLLNPAKGEKHYKFGVFGGDNFLSKKVVKMDMCGNVLALFNSMTEAAEDVNTNKAVISRACSGKLKTARGYIWKCA